MSDLARQLRRRADALNVTRPRTSADDVRLLRCAADALDDAIVVPPEAFDCFAWLAAERAYQVEKYGIEADDDHASEGFDQGAWWHDCLHDRVRRAAVLDTDSAVGRQALAKVASTAAGMLEAFMRVNGPPPPAGAPSGEVGS